MSELPKPETPAHPGPDVELERSEEPGLSDSNMEAQLERPGVFEEAGKILDFDDDDDEDDANIDLMGKSSNDNGIVMPGKEVKPTITESEMEDSVMSSSETSITDTAGSVNSCLMSEFNDNLSRNAMNPIDLNEIDSRLYARPVNPFDQIGSLNPIDTNLRIINSNSYKKLTHSQQHKLTNYLDLKLLNIQKKFVKYVSGETDYPLGNLITELNEIVILIWYSIFQLKSIPLIYHPLTQTNDTQTIDLPDLQNKDIKFKNFGQIEYTVKIMGDLNDFLLKYEFKDFKDIDKLLKFLIQLDNFIVILIEYSSESTHLKLIHNTELVRIESIINSTKLICFEKFDHFKSKVFDSVEINDNNVKEQLSQFEVLIGQIYEGILDKTSI